MIGHFASGVTVITARHGDEQFGTTASAVSSLSLEPPMLLVCMNKTSATGRAIEASGRFGVNILTEDQPQVAERFARKGGGFDGIPVVAGSWGENLLAEALATLECRVTEEVTGGTHTVFIAAVDSATARAAASPLAYFRGQFGRLELAPDATASEEIRGLVISGRLPAGEPIELAELAERVDVPPGAAYHALGKLVAEGLVERVGGSFRVVPINLEAVEAALDCRLAVELGVLEVTVGKVDRGELAALRRMAEEGDPSRDGFAMDEYVEHYRRFRERLVALASPVLARHYESMNGPALIAVGTAARAAAAGVEREAAERAHRHHQRLLTAYEAGDLGLARATVERHVEEAREFAGRHLGESG